MTFFGIQLALRARDLLPRRKQLADLVRARGRAATAYDMRALWSQAAPLLLECLPAAELAFWDLIREEGQAEYEDWATGLEAMGEWSENDFGNPAFGDGLVLVSALFLVEPGSNADLLLGDRCDLPEEDWMKRDTLRHLLATCPMLNMTGVRGCGLYLAPGADLAGFSKNLLEGADFDYLLKVE